VAQQGAPLLEHFQDTVKNDLSRDLAEYGIELVRLNFETPKVLDAQIAKEMSNQSLLTAQVNARESVLLQQSRIARVEAEQQATVLRISVEQQNNNKLTQARTELESAKLRAEALIIEAEARQKAAAFEGSQYAAYPQLLQIKLTELQTQAMAKSNMTLLVTPQEFQSSFSGMANVASLGNLTQQFSPKNNNLNGRV